MIRGVAQLRTGVSVPYYRAGEAGGLPIVLLHGWGESARAFDRLLPELPADHPVFAFDQRGHGGAGEPARGYGLDDAALDVIAFLDAMAIRSAVLLGSSSGGYVAQQTAVLHPHQVSGLILVGAPLSLHGRAPFADEVEALADPVSPEWAERTLELFPVVSPVPSWYLADRENEARGMTARSWQRTLTALTSARPPTVAGQIRCPTLILRGEGDDLVPAQDHEALAAAIPGARLVVYKRTGHLVLWERPEQCGADISHFLRSVA